MLCNTLTHPKHQEIENSKGKKGKLDQSRKSDIQIIGVPEKKD